MNAGDGHGRALEHVPVAIGRTEDSYVSSTVTVVVGRCSDVSGESPGDNACVAIERVLDPPLAGSAIDRQIESAVAIEVAANRFVGSETPI